MVVMVVVLIISLLIAIFYIVHLKINIKKATNDIHKIRFDDTNALITTSSSNKELRNLLKEVNNMMVSFRQLELEIENKHHNLQRTIINISHDLKTPLTSALGYVELLQKYDLSLDEQQKYENIVIEKLKRLSQLIEDFFAFTKIIANEEDIVMEKMDVNRIFEEAIVCFYEDFNVNQRNLYISGNKKIEMLTNERVLRRIFDNLIINALKHSSGDIYIDIQTNDGVSFQFKNKLDELIEVNHIFDEFYTSDISRTKQHTGLGLAIVKEFTEILGGKVSADIEDNNLIITLKWDNIDMC